MLGKSQLALDRLTGHGGISSIGSGSTGGGSSPFSPHHHHHHHRNTTPTNSGPGSGGSGGMATHHQDFQPPYFPPPFPPTHHHQHHQSSTTTSPSAMDYLSDPYSQTLNSIQSAQVAAAHYNQLTVAAVSAGQRHDALRRADTADSIHVILFFIEDMNMGFAPEPLALLNPPTLPLDNLAPSCWKGSQGQWPIPVQNF
ncbi:hypothetical protein V9T40_013862 [Parthenolecanium corni]|uniref:Uncharacterized protein n=1 Tax=Parthenolecanium corni TaxID=536013 RepID=A0AAN9Y1P0_9HEMI